MAALFLLTGAFGRSFSKLELGVSWLHPTELLLALAFGAILVRVSTRQAVIAVRRTGVVVCLLVLWLAGAVAAVRGLVDWGFTRTLNDIGLVEYSLVVPLLALAIRSRAELLWICQVVAISGLLAIATFAASTMAPAEWQLAPELNLISAASGLYATIYVGWVLARAAAGVAVAPWEYAASLLAVGLIVVGSARSAWVGLLAALVAVVAFSLPGLRLTVAVRAAAVILAGAALSPVLERVHLIEAPSPSTVATQLLTGSSAEGVDSVRRADAGTAGRAEAAAGSRGPKLVFDRSVPGGAAGSAAAPAGIDTHPDSLFPGAGAEGGDTRDYISFGSNELSSSAANALAGRHSLWAVYRDDPRLVKTLTYLPLEAGRRHRASAWVYLPGNWDGGSLMLSTDGTWAQAAESPPGSTNTRGRWTRIVTEFTPAGDLVGGLHIRTTEAPSPGRGIFIDNVTLTALAAPPAAPGSAAPIALTDESSDGTSGLGELAASFRPSAQRANSAWRLAFWEFVLAESTHQPLFGVGFGRPADFEWQGIRYDSRRGDATDPFDVSGPHNSFLNLLYRTGLPGLVALVALMSIAVIRLVSVIRPGGPQDRAVAIWLLGGLAAATAAASFSVALEGPFMGIYFWALLGLALLAPALLSRPSADSDGRPADGP